MNLDPLPRLVEMVAPRSALRLRVARDSRIGEPDLRVIASLPRGRLAIDVGANLGVYTWELARRYDHVVAVEPNPECVLSLRRAAPSNVTVIPAALTDRVGRATLHVPEGRSLHFRSSLHEDIAGQHASTSREDCLMLTVDVVAPGPVEFIKIDVEGAELAVLSGAQRTLTGDRPVVMIEADERVRPGAVQDISAALAELAYVPFQPQGRPDRGRWANFWFAHRDHPWAARPGGDR